MSSAIYFDFDQSKILSSGNGLNVFAKRIDACQPEQFWFVFANPSSEGS